MPSTDNDREQLIAILTTVKERFTDNSDMMWTGYDTAEEMRNELNACIQQLNNNDLTCLDALDLHFTPTSTFQEHSLSNGWTDEYMTISQRFDDIYSRLKASS